MFVPSWSKLRKSSHIFLKLHLFPNRGSGGSSSGSRGAPAPPRPKNTMEPPLSPPFILEKKRWGRRRGRREERRNQPPFKNFWIRHCLWGKQTPGGRPNFHLSIPLISPDQKQRGWHTICHSSFLCNWRHLSGLWISPIWHPVDDFHKPGCRNMSI